MNAPKQLRLDQRLVAEGLVATRSRARDLILRGYVCVDEIVCDKPARVIGQLARISLRPETPGYVSRGAEKLLAALDHFAIDCRGRVALDIGASTGGFSQVLLQRGVAKVYAVDVGRDQLHADLRNDARVVSLEDCDARQLVPNRTITDNVSLITADVSFISLTKVLPAAFDLASADAQLIALVKPQFELSPQDIGKGGIVRDAQSRARALSTVKEFVAAHPGWRVLGSLPSPIAGGSGNMEFLIGAARDG